MFYSVLFVLPFLSSIHALNDWSVPASTANALMIFRHPITPRPVSGTLKIWGSDTAITDITKAAHWQILGCDPNALSQDIRLVCMNDPDDPSSNCEHLYKDIGAVNKIVRLPENCGASAFARISRSWVPDDQSIPPPSGAASSVAMGCNPSSKLSRLTRISIKLSGRVYTKRARATHLRFDTVSADATHVSRLIEARHTSLNGNVSLLSFAAKPHQSAADQLRKHGKTIRRLFLSHPHLLPSSRPFPDAFSIPKRPRWSRRVLIDSLPMGTVTAFQSSIFLPSFISDNPRLFINDTWIDGFSCSYRVSWP
ncbi:hypothetical protein R3P38DRAFT_372960 [Favolaschia claudopus]|uniref:Uncharacterized protein n=1 Tax=Favolaschia claudopus TaxID=2862362 RepID=A0AAV9ZID1_9AGAR